MERVVLIGGLGVALLSLVTFCFQGKIGLTAFEFGDETQYIVAAQMLTQGGHLYKDIFTHHGPLPVMISHLYASTVDRFDFSYIRISQIALAAASCVAVMLSPALKTLSEKTWAVALYMLLLSSVWVPQLLHMVLYQSMGGFFLVVLLSQSVVPLYLGDRPTRNGLFASGTATVFAGFSAYPFFLVSFLFICSCLVLLVRTRDQMQAYIKPFILGVLVATAVVISWLWVFGDIHGYWIYHIYFNQEIYSRFINFSPSSIFDVLSFSFSPDEIVGTMTFMLLLACLLTLLGLNRIANGSRRAWSGSIVSIALIAGGIVLANARGGSWFQENGLLITTFALFSISSSVMLQRSVTKAFPRRVLSALALMIGAVIFAQSASLVFAKSSWMENAGNFKTELKPEKSEIYDFVRSITKQEGDLLALIYSQIVYVKAGRFPASGHFYYLPWQADYGKNPKEGYQIDICSDIERKKPAVIWFFNWRVWNKYSLENYEPCVLSLIVASYTPLEFNSPWYIRDDILAAHSATLPTGIGFKSPFGTELPFVSILKQSSPLEAGAPIKILMTPEHMVRQHSLRQLGVLFTTNNIPRSGEAELNLQALSGAEYSVRFNLSNTLNNEYHYFELPPKRYTAGEIRAISGEGISAWESDLESTATCIIYEYIDGSRAYTPSCPLKGAGHSSVRADGANMRAGNTDAIPFSEHFRTRDSMSQSRFSDF